MIKSTSAASSPATPWALRLPQSRGPLQACTGSGLDHQHHHQHHQRLPLQLPAELVGLGAATELRRRSPGWAAPLKSWRQPVGEQQDWALQRQHSEHPRPLLGRPRSDVPRRHFHAERQPPVPVWRHLSAQLGLPSAQRQRRRHQLPPVYELGNGTHGSELASSLSDFAHTLASHIPNCSSLTAAALGIVSIAPGLTPAPAPI